MLDEDSEFDVGDLIYSSLVLMYGIVVNRSKIISSARIGPDRYVEWIYQIRYTNGEEYWEPISNIRLIVGVNDGKKG